MSCLRLQASACIKWRFVVLTSVTACVPLEFTKTNRKMEGDGSFFKHCVGHQSAKYLAEKKASISHAPVALGASASREVSLKLCWISCSIGTGYLDGLCTVRCCGVVHAFVGI